LSDPNSPYSKKENPQYNSSGAAADGFKVHGGTTGNQALIFGVNNKTQKFSYTPLMDQTYTALTGAGYAAKEITYLRDMEKAAGNVAGPATEGQLETALSKIGDAVAANKGKVNVDLMVVAPGGLSERTVVYNNNGVGQPGGGAVVSNANSHVGMFVDDPTVVAGLKLDLPRSPANGGGVWLSDPVAER
jgi:hypothetical protein